MYRQLKGDIEPLITVILDALGLDLIDLDIKKNRNGTVLDVITDRPRGGITLDECALVNKRVLEKLGGLPELGDRFTVEVSSPGVDRALETRNDFNRCYGRKVRVHLREPVAEKLEHVGEVGDVTQEHVSIVKKDNAVIIPLKLITKAVQVI